MRYLLALLLLAVSTAGFSQVENPVKWDFKAVKKADKLYEVIITATVDKPWHIYSQFMGDGGPVPTSFTFKTNPLILLDGKVKEEGSLQTTHDKNFGMDVKYFSNKVQFIQLVKLKGNVKTNIAGTVEYMVCNDEKCLPPSKKAFDIKLL